MYVKITRGTGAVDVFGVVDPELGTAINSASQAFLVLCDPNAGMSQGVHPIRIALTYVASSSGQYSGSAVGSGVQSGILWQAVLFFNNGSGRLTTHRPDMVIA